MNQNSEDVMRSDVYHMHVRQHHIDYVERLLNTNPVYNLSHRGFAANQVGFLGEALVTDFLTNYSISFKSVNLTTHDLELSSGQKIEIKTKDRTVRPKNDFDCTLPLYNHSHQQPDYYIFVSLIRSKDYDNRSLFRFTEGWILGAASPELMKTKGKVWRSGQTDFSNGTKFWTDCLNISIKDLDSLKGFVTKYSNNQEHQ